MARAVRCTRCPQLVPVTWPPGGNPRWCTACTAYASGLRDQGATWRKIAEAIGASGPGAAYNLVERYRARTA